MSEYSEMMGSFIRTGNYPLEANYIFNTEQELLDFYADPINKTTMHEGLLRVVGVGDDQYIYWVVKRGENLVWEKFTPDAELTQEIVATNVNVGNIKDGDVLPEGMSFTDFVLKLLITPKKPTYTVSSISDLASPIEVGTAVNGATGKYTQLQGGAITNATATITGFIDANTPTISFSGSTVNIVFTGRIAEGNNTVSSTVTYAASTSFPEITAGTLTNSKTIVGVRRYFMGNGLAPTEGFRSNTSILAASTFKYALGAGATDMWLALPANKTIKEITDEGALGAVITSNFKKVSTVQIDGATAGKDAIDYNIYQLSGYGPFGAGHNMNITIA